MVHDCSFELGMIYIPPVPSLAIKKSSMSSFRPNLGQDTYFSYLKNFSAINETEFDTLKKNLE